MSALPKGNEKNREESGYESREELPLSKAAEYLIEECRMVLPGIQALFGFQMIAVFNQRFRELPGSLQIVHLAATGLVALAAGLVMTPAAYHRTAEPFKV